MRFFGVVLGFAVLLAAGASTAQAQEFRLKLHHFLSPLSHGHANMLVPWAKTIEEQSQGRIKIDIFPAMQLGGRPPSSSIKRAMAWSTSSGRCRGTRRAVSR